jgi:hypothetical protein
MRGDYLIHVRTGGKTYQLPTLARDLDRAASDRRVVRHVAGRLGLPLDSLDDHAVDRRADGMVVRPWAVWG